MYEKATFYITASLWHEFRQLALAHGCSASAYLRVLIADALHHAQDQQTRRVPASPEASQDGGVHHYDSLDAFARHLAARIHST
jgi:hypothetical protein